MNALTAPRPASALMDPAQFDQMQRVGRMLAMSPLFPEALRKGGQETAIANAVLTLNMAARLNEDVLTVAQNIYFVSGKPGWSTAYLISKANQHGAFSNPIDWKIEGRGTDNLSVTAFAETAGTGKRVEFTCDMKMAKAEGWTSNKKYQSMPEVMLRYRSAAFLIRFYCPEVMIGVPAQVEIELGMKDVTPEEFRDRTQTPAATTPEEPEDAVIVPSEDHDPETGEVAPDADPEEGDADAGPSVDQEAFQGLHDMIMRDLLDAGSVDDVQDLYADNIQQMKDQAPKLHQSLMAEFEAYRKEQA